jgi:hypothetical protein
VEKNKKNIHSAWTWVVGTHLLWTVFLSSSISWTVTYIL